MIPLLLLACGTPTIEYTASVEGCRDWNPTETTTPYLDIYEDNGDLVVERWGVIQSCDAAFTPVIEPINGYKISIREYWDASDTSPDCETCLAPTIRFSQYPSRTLEFWWYLGNEAISFDVIDTELVD